MRDKHKSPEKTDPYENPVVFGVLGAVGVVGARRRSCGGGGFAGVGMSSGSGGHGDDGFDKALKNLNLDLPSFWWNNRLFLLLLGCWGNARHGYLLKGKNRLR